MKTILSVVIAFAFLPFLQAQGVKPDFPTLVYIPAGTTVLQGDTISVDALWVSDTEITNAQYLTFLQDIIANGDFESFNTCKIDTAAWYTIKVYGSEEYAKNYHQWLNMPVVNISYQAALLFCDWLTETMVITGDLDVPKFRLPTEKEWMYAALGGESLSDDPWGNQLVTGRGVINAQFKSLGLYNGPVEVKSFKANNFGLFDMLGNVAEMLGDLTIVKGGSWKSDAESLKLRNRENYEKSPYVGFRVYRTYVAEQ